MKKGIISYEIKKSQENQPTTGRNLHQELGHNRVHFSKKIQVNSWNYKKQKWHVCNP